MSNILDQLFAAKKPLQYAFTSTDVGPPGRVLGGGGQPHIDFATGVLEYEETLGGGGPAQGLLLPYLYVKRFVDHNPMFWFGEGNGFKPAAMTHSTNLELEVGKTASGYYFKYFDRTNPVQRNDPGWTGLEISDGGNFPGMHGVSAVIIFKLWLGAFVLVLGPLA